MNRNATLTSTQAAKLAAVTPSTIKRWADSGLLPFSRTAGGHRRFTRHKVLRFLEGRCGAEPSAVGENGKWIDILVRGLRHEVDGRLLEAKARHGEWHGVADELGQMLTEVGEKWRKGTMPISEEHRASTMLGRALVRVGNSLPTPIDGPRCILASVAGEHHTLGLALAELCLLEKGLNPIWLGGPTPTKDIIQSLRSTHSQVVALSASIWSSSVGDLTRVVDEVGLACQEEGALLLLGGCGPWPEGPAYGIRLHSFAELHAYAAVVGLPR